VVRTPHALSTNLLLLLTPINAPQMMLESGHGVERDLEGKWRLGNVVQRTHPVQISLENGLRVISIDTAAWRSGPRLLSDQCYEETENPQAPTLFPGAKVGRVISGAAARVRKAMAAKATSAGLGGGAAQMTIPEMVQGMQGRPSATLVPRIPATDKLHPGQQLKIEQMWASRPPAAGVQCRETQKGFNPRHSIEPAAQARPWNEMDVDEE